MIDLLHYVQENRNKDYTVGSAFIDLSSAFDLVDHKILLNKLKLFGVSRSGLEWIRSFLQDRSQIVVVKDSKSQPFSLDYGLPQGSPLSPLLYLIYVADAHLWCKDSFNAAFADDFNFSCIARSREEVKKLLQPQSRKVKNYFENNRLLLNPNKTEVIIFDKKSRNRLSENIEILDSIIPVTDTVRVLGLNVQNDLTWKAHTESMIRNLQYRTGILKRLRSILTPKQLETIAQGLIVSKLRYGLSVYSSLRFTESDGNSKESQKIQVLLNDVMRTLRGAKRKDRLHIEDLISEYPWGSYNRMALKTQICDIWKFINCNNHFFYFQNTTCFYTSEFEVLT